MTPWTTHLKKLPKDEQKEDIFNSFKEEINLQITNNLSLIVKSLLDEHKEYTPETANKMAINLMMEQLLQLQYIHTPQSQVAMTIELFTHIPEMKNFREEIVIALKQKIQEDSTQKKPLQKPKKNL